jgi:hypothetical protein
MKIWFISDTHCQHEKLEVPDVDMVIHCGDEATSRDPAWNAVEAEKFFEWYRGLPIRDKVFVPGNHSVAFSRGMTSENTYKEGGIRVLRDHGMLCGELSVYGSPWTPSWGGCWAYMRSRPKMHDVWQTLPEYADIIVTHGPPKGILDITHDHDTGHLIQVGCRSLRKRIEQIKPKIHAFGHIHDEDGVNNYGVYHRHDTLFVNCSVCDRKGKFKNPGIVLEI